MTTEANAYSSPLLLDIFVPATTVLLVASSVTFHSPHETLENGDRRVTATRLGQSRSPEALTTRSHRTSTDQAAGDYHRARSGQYRSLRSGRTSPPRVACHCCPQRHLGGPPYHSERRKTLVAPSTAQRARREAAAPSDQRLRSRLCTHSSTCFSSVRYLKITILMLQNRQQKPPSSRLDLSASGTRVARRLLDTDNQ